LPFNQTVAKEPTPSKNKKYRLPISPFFTESVIGQSNLRQDIILNNNWKTTAADLNEFAIKGFEKEGFADDKWVQVSVPHNWDA